MTITAPAQVYYCYAGTDLVYIGQSINLRARVAQHIKTKTWWADVTAVVATPHMPRPVAMAIEAREIAAHEPIHNYVGTTAWKADMPRRAVPSPP